MSLRALSTQLKEAVADLDKPEDDDRYHLMWLRGNPLHLSKHHIVAVREVVTLH